MEINTKTAVIEDLVETLEDGYKGFTQVADKLSGDDSNAMASKFRGYADQRKQFSSELRRLAGDSGFEIKEDGSAGAAMHRGWISLADALTGDDPHAVLAAAEAGEDHAVSEYEDALKDESLTGEMRDVVSHQFNEVKKAHDDVRNMRDANA